VGEGTRDVAVDSAVAVDLEGLIEEALIGGLVVVECVGVLGPSAHFELDAEWGGGYNGGFMISFLIGFMNLFAFIIYYFPTYWQAATSFRP
jgi:hypothetical protein